LDAGSRKKDGIGNGSRFEEGDSVSRFDTGHSGRTGNNKESIRKKVFIVFVFVGIIG
jgi:hypothetical protein